MGSIDHFHHQLQLLEHAGPKTVAPAYRLHTAFPGAGSRAVRGTCRLLAPEAGAPAADRRRSGGRRRRRRRLPLRAGRGARPARTGVPARGGRAICPSYRREQARRRCTMLLRCLAGVAISTGLIGMFPGMHLAWVFTGLTGPGGAGPRRSDGLRQGARGRAGPPPFPARGRPGIDVGAGRRPGGGRLSRRLGRRRRIRGTPGRRTLTQLAVPAANRSAPGPSGSPTILGGRRGCSSAGRALRSQCRGRGFESLHLHQEKPRSPGWRWNPPVRS